MDGGVRDRRLERLLPRDDALQTAALLKEFLRLLLIVPEVGRAGLCLDLLQLLALRRDIKGTSRAARPAPAGLRNSRAALVLKASRSFNLRKP
jgi:hypothetical protein